jgi:hypothetical protein
MNKPESTAATPGSLNCAENVSWRKYIVLKLGPPTSEELSIARKIIVGRILRLLQMLPGTHTALQGFGMGKTIEVDGEICRCQQPCPALRYMHHCGRLAR